MRAWYRRKSPEQRRAWVARRDREKIRQREREAYANDPAVKARKRAYGRVKVKMDSGRLVPSPCEMAGPDCVGSIEAHHEDYARPLNVRWLCRFHHAQHHARRS
jgi:hypothetical protein